MNKEEIAELKEKEICFFVGPKGYGKTYYEFQKLQQEYKKLKELNKELISVLKSVRKDINFPELCDGYLVIDILDKVKKNN